MCMINRHEHQKSIDFKPGFRLRISDIAIIFFGVWFSCRVGVENFNLGLSAAFVIFHFFLFCNILRMNKSLELVWSGLYLLLFILASTEAFGGFVNYLGVYVYSLVITSLLIGFQINREDYHGVFWERINPELPKWWRQAAVKG